MSSTSTKSTHKAKNIFIKGARHNNLKNVDVTIPQNKLVVVTGVSGSGKSSLAFDTLYAEGQRRYIESLSAYIRQFVGKINKPEVDYIRGISPAIAIQQKVNTTNPRSTVGTTTEIYDYMKLLFARAGKTISPISGQEVKRDTVSDVLKYLNEFEKGTKAQILAPLVLAEDRKLVDELNVVLQKGFTRVVNNGKVVKVQDLLLFIEGSKTNLKSVDEENLFLLIDRIVVDNENKENLERIADSVQTAFFEGHGACLVEVFTNDEVIQKTFSSLFEADGMQFEEPSVNLFTFNNPYGACKSCEGFGTVIGIEEDKVIPDKGLSVYEGAVACWKGEKMQEYKDWFIKHSAEYEFPIHRPYYQLNEEEKNILWNGKGKVEGINQFFDYIQSQSYKIQYRVMLSRYKGKAACNDCKGTRLRADANYVKVDGKSISELVLLPIDELAVVMQNLQLDAYQKDVSKRILTEINSRLEFLLEVGLAYLSLNRDARTLSGGESQRIQLVTSLGSTLTGSMYILDEPSIGLHPKDTEKLIQVLRRLRDLKNTVIVVEHDEEIIRAADYIIDMGPYAGSLGGEVVFEGNHEDLLLKGNSLTTQYINGTMSVPLPEKRKIAKYYIDIKQAYKHNLQRVDVRIPLHCMTVITGVSGSGKSTLVKEVILPSLQNKLRNPNGEPKNCIEFNGDYSRIKQVEYVDQNPIGRSSRSNPVTYIKAYDGIRSLMAQQGISKQRGYTPAFFSFNVDGGRCTTCRGDGFVTVEMQFMADLHLVCEECKGTRFKKEILDVKFQDKNIADILELTVDEAVEFFKDKKDIHNRLEVLQSVGLGYLRLGQPSNNLSGGEAQRIKLAYFLTEGAKDESILFIFDEPTTGLHFHDINYLLTAFAKLIDKGHTLLIIEHNQEVMKCADWLIDLGPEGGRNGGQILFQGQPEDIVNADKSITRKYLIDKLKR